MDEETMKCKKDLKFWIMSLVVSTLMLAVSFAILASYLAAIKENTSIANQRLNALDAEVAVIHRHVDIVAVQTGAQVNQLGTANGNPAMPGMPPVPAMPGAAATMPPVAVPMMGGPATGLQQAAPGGVPGMPGVPSASGALPPPAGGAANRMTMPPMANP